jgi:hypothetical protein
VPLCLLGPDCEWFDATSKWGQSAEHADLLAEVDQLSRQISMAQTGPWVPDPPLRFAGQCADTCVCVWVGGGGGGAYTLAGVLLLLMVVGL